MVEIELILNYFPHIIWRSENDLMRLRDRFYYPLLDKISESIDIIDNR